MIPLATLASPAAWRIAAAAAAAAALFAAGAYAGHRWAAADLATERARHAQAIADAQAAARQASEDARRREHDIIDRTEEIVANARQTVEALRADAAAADRAADGLRLSAARYAAAARRCTGTPATPAGGSPPADPSAGMQDGDRLLVVLGQLDARAGALAAHADAARAAGDACQRAYGAAVDALKAAR